MHTRIPDDACIRAYAADTMLLDRACAIVDMTLSRYDTNEFSPHVSQTHQPYDGESWTQWAEVEQRLGNPDRAAFNARRGAELQSARELRNRGLDASRPLARKWAVSRTRPKSFETDRHDTFVTDS